MDLEDISGAQHEEILDDGEHVIDPGQLQNKFSTLAAGFKDIQTASANNADLHVAAEMSEAGQLRKGSDESSDGENKEHDGKGDDSDRQPVFRGKH